MNIRKVGIFIGLPLVALGLVLFLMTLGNGASQKAHAQAATTDFSITAPGCDSNGPTTKCSEPIGSAFTVTLNLNSQAADWSGYDADIKFSAPLSYVNTCSNSTGSGGCSNSTNKKFGSLDQSLWPSCAFATGEIAFSPGTYTPDAGGQENGPGDAPFACADSDASVQTYTGPLASLQFDCKGPTQPGAPATLTLHNGAGATDIATAAGASFESADETLSINCVAATATFTPVPTNTPPSQPRVAKTCKETVKPTLPPPAPPGTPDGTHPNGETTGGALCNHFLVREGAKIPPARCQDSINVVNLNEGINIPISFPNPKAGQPNEPALQQLGAFEFEIRFDAKLVCVSIAGAGPFSPGPNVICSTLDNGSKGLIRFGCVTVKKNQHLNDQCTHGCTLAVISVRPTEETVNQLRPNQDNGIPVQLMNQGCQLSDDQGHEIPIFSCEDADVTFRFLEGDVSGPDCVVNVMDAQQQAFRWGARQGSLLFNSFNDLSPSGQIKGDGRIDIQDLQFVFGRLNSTCNAPYPLQPPVNPKA